MTTSRWSFHRNALNEGQPQFILSWIHRPPCSLHRKPAAVDELIDGIAGVTRTAFSSLSARCAPRGDLAIRRSIERVVFEVRAETAKV